MSMGVEMKIYVLREDATGMDYRDNFSDILMGAFTTREAAEVSAQASLGIWKNSYCDRKDYYKDSGWVEYREVSEGGWIREINFDDIAGPPRQSLDEEPWVVALIFKIYEMELR